MPSTKLEKMQIIHGTWIPQDTDSYLQLGSFCLWVETDQEFPKRKKKVQHPRSLKKDELATFLKDKLGLPYPNPNHISTKYITLPAVDGVPLKSYELMQFSDFDYSDDYQFKTFEIESYQVPLESIFGLLKDIHFLFSFSSSEIQMSAGLLFWHHYTQVFKEFILKDRYIPALKYQELDVPKGRRKKNDTHFEIHPTWAIISDKYDAEIQNFADIMPQICVATSETPPKGNGFFSRKGLLKHFSENVLLHIIRKTPSTQAFDKRIAHSFLFDCFHGYRFDNNEDYWKSNAALEKYKQWQIWSHKLKSHHSNSPFVFCFKLEAPKAKKKNWTVHFQLQSKADPSLQIGLDDYWKMNTTAQKRIKKEFGADLEKNIVLNLGYAAKMYPKLWDGLETDKPTEITLTTDDAYDFLKESSWILQESDYKVIVPTWWTPEGRRKAKIRLKTSSKKGKKTSAAGKSFFGKDAIVQYRYELAIGGQPVSPKEWDELVNAKSSLVKFRGEWLELDQNKMSQMLDFWEKHADKEAEIDVLGLIKLAADDEEFEFEHDEVLAEMMAKLQDKTRFEVIPNPKKLKGELRDYQKRGVSWLHYLENLNLNGCLADDMGLGKTIQVIALLINEREDKKKVLPTLLIVPTSVIGNWNHEINKFAPQLTNLIHHGSTRISDSKEFKKTIAKYDTVITSFALIRRDEKLFQSAKWERIVLDEAQNIKNPKAAQTKAILKLTAKHRLALTGTPVENRLMDLWSIFNFLNPGYLETQAKFRKIFELPIQKENDLVKTKVLKNLVEPFILRRMKTDKSIIKDLPEKVEQKVYCTLSKEQASLYEAVVKDVLEQMEEAEGIQRKGLILASLAKLKQICNHPAQFLQDNSEFTKARSHKLSRLVEMVEEAIESGESILIFSQYKTIVESLNQFIQEKLRYKTYVLHGGVTRKKREKMILEFQDQDNPPAVFILSIKAGGVGITLTKANHVFHFDRWWNPAVEDQATDRAFRIGQEKNVFVHKFVTMGTLEERIDLMIEEKKKLSGSIVGDDESWLSELDNESFKNLISLNKNAVWA